MKRLPRGSLRPAQVNRDVRRMGLAFAGGALVLVFVAGGAVFLARGQQETRRRHASLGPAEVKAALQCVLDDTQYHDAFDLFLAWPIDDPYLESIRTQCCEIVRTSPPPRRAEDVSESCKDQIRALLVDLRGRV
jgi:hypothetical protein